MNSQAQPILKTERLLLRPFIQEDAARVQLLAGDKRISEMVANIPHPYPDGAASEWISTHRSGWESGSRASFAIIDKTTNILMGAISLVGKTAESGVLEAELGYWLGVDYWGAGLVTEAGKRIIQLGFDELGLQRIHARRLSHNPASGRVLEKIGLVHIGQREGMCGDKFGAIEHYELLKT